MKAPTPPCLTERGALVAKSEFVGVRTSRVADRPPFGREACTGMTLRCCIGKLGGAFLWIEPRTRWSRRIQLFRHGASRAESPVMLEMEGVAKTVRGGVSSRSCNRFGTGLSLLQGAEGGMRWQYWLIRFSFSASGSPQSGSSSRFRWRHNPRKVVASAFLALKGERVKAYLRGNPMHYSGGRLYPSR